MWLQFKLCRARVHTCLGCRLQRSDVDMRQFCDCLQGADNSRFAQMCGVIPAILSLDEKRFSDMVHDFSTPLLSYPVRQISLRGLKSSQDIS